MKLQPLFALALVPIVACAALQKTPISSLVHPKANQTFQVNHTDAEWKKMLPAESYEVLRKGGTETAFTGKYAESKAKGVYACAGCGQILFDSATKFDSGTGWPSFYKEIVRGRTMTRGDESLGMSRDEVICSRCGSHLGHVFDDGPEPTGLRYCMNSAALKFIKKG